MDNYDKYIRYSDALKKILEGQKILQWINGSFVTQIIDPHDIDLVSFIDYEICEKWGAALNSFGANGAMQIYGVDAYIVPVYPKGHENYSFYLSDAAYWKDKFDKTRRDRNGRRNSKGYLEIIY